MKNNQSEIGESIILCGGMGSRLRSVINLSPKPLAPIGSRVFLDLLVESLMEQNIKKIIFAVGYMREQIIQRYSGLNGVEVCFSEEETQLGTGGAVKKATKYVEENFFLAINGDSYIDISYGDLAKEIYKKKADSLILVKKNSGNRSDVGLFKISEDHMRIIGFTGSDFGDKNRYINCGVYLFNKNYFMQESMDVFSLENYFLPKLIKETCVIPYISELNLYDIGTPERYEEFVRKHA
jgi:D-glycero-alpha-D-manno-heptose 1-phosphate guanylyltransferase